MNGALQLVYLPPLGLMTLLIVVLGCSLCQLFGKILANAVKESVHDESSEVVTFVAKVIANHVLAAHVV